MALVVLDASVLANFSLCDTLLRLTEPPRLNRKAGWDSAYRSRVPVPAIVELPEAA